MSSLHTSDAAPSSERGESDLTQAARDVLAERRRQVEAEGWSHYRDDGYVHRELANAAACYARQAGHAKGYAPGDLPFGFPWPSTWWKPTTPRRDLVKAGALILAEIERLDRAEAAALTAGASR